MEVVPYAHSLRSLKRGALVGAALGLVAFLFALGLGGGSLRTWVAGLLICVGGGAWWGSLLAVRLTAGDRPESKRGYLRLLGLSTLAGFGCLLLGMLLVR